MIFLKLIEREMTIAKRTKLLRISCDIFEGRQIHHAAVTGRTRVVHTERYLELRDDAQARLMVRFAN